jgi:hypothetical protein
MSDIKSNQERIDDIFTDMLGQSANQKPQGGDEVGTNNLNEPVVETQTEPVVEPVVEPNELEPSDASNPNPEVDTPEVGDAGDGGNEPDTEEVDDLFSDWDIDAVPADPTANENEPQSIDYTSITNELGIEINTNEDLINAYKKLKEDASKAEKYSKLPADIIAAVELANKGQDYTTVFKKSDAIDHKSYDDRTLLLNQNSKYFTDPEGKVDMDGLSEYVDDMTEIQQTIEASKVREQIDEYNLRKREEGVRTQQENRDRAQAELQSAISETSDIKGFKVTPQHKDDAMKNISSGEAVKEMFYKEDGKSYDMNKLFEVYFLYKNFDKMKSFLSRRAKDDVRKEDFNNVSNANINVSEHRTNVSDVTKPDSLTDVYLDVLKQKAGLNQNI